MSAKIEVRDHAYRMARVREEINGFVAYVANTQQPDVMQK